MAAESPGAKALPQGTTFPRGFPGPGSIHWPLVPARELFELNYGKALVESQRRTGNVPVYGTNGRCGSHDTPLFFGPGVILGRKGQGPLGVEWSDEDFWVIDTAYSLVPRRSDVDLKYSYFLIKHIGLNHLKDGTSNPTLSRDSFGAQLLPLPPMPVQLAIAYILGTLDEKIELNRQMNETLEAMARALFKSWFVDFDFVLANADGEEPRHKHLGHPFPDSLEHSEMGMIPKAWEPGTLADFATLNPETWSGATRPQNIRYVDLSNTKWGRIETVTNYFGQAAPSRAQRILRQGDTIVGTVRPGNGSYALISEDGLTGSTGFAVLRPRKEKYREFTYLAATAADSIEALSHLADGGAYPAVRPEVVSATRIVRAPDSILAEFSRLTVPLLARMAENERANGQLTAVRDALLPKLISGELRVRDADRIIGGLV